MRKCYAIIDDNGNVKSTLRTGGELSKDINAIKITAEEFNNINKKKYENGKWVSVTAPQNVEISVSTRLANIEQKLDQLLQK